MLRYKNFVCFQIVRLLDREKVEKIKLVISVEDLAAAKGQQKVESKRPENFSVILDVNF